MRFRFLFGALIVVLGISLLVDFPFFKFVFAAFIIWLGIKVLTGERGYFNFGEKMESSENTLNKVLIFSGVNEKSKSSDFQGGEIAAIFGGGEIDLTNAKVKKNEITLNITAIFGGLKVIVPQTWSVGSEGVGILGTFSNITRLKAKKATDLKIKGAAILGSVEILN